MTVISKDSTVFSVITRVFINDETREQVLKLAKKSHSIFAKQPGFISLAQHLSHDKSHLLTYLQRKSQRDHEACMISPDFKDLNQEWEKLLSSEKIKFELHTYDILESLP